MPSAVRTACRTTIARAPGDITPSSAITCGAAASSSRYPSCSTGAGVSHSRTCSASTGASPCLSNRAKVCSARMRFDRGQSVASSKVSAMRNSRYATDTARRVGCGRYGIASAKVRLVFSKRSSRSAIPECARNTAGDRGSPLPLQLTDNRQKPLANVSRKVW